MSVPAQLRAALGILILLLLGILAAGFYVPYKLNSSANQKYAEDVIPLRALVDDLVLRVARQQSDVQAYLLTTDSGHVKAFQAAVGRANADLTQILRRHPSLDPLVRRATVQISELNGILQRVLASGSNSPVILRQPELYEIANRKFVALRRTATRLQAQTERRREALDAEQRSTYRRLLVTLGILGAIGLAIAGSLLILTPRRVGQAYEAEERARREAESRADATRALEHVGDGVVLTDPEGHVRFVNPAAERLLRLEPGTSVGRRLTDVLHAWGEVERRSAAGGVAATIVPLELGHSERWLAVRSVDFHEGVVYALRDVTEERALERMRSDFVATASHELRTPMTSIYGAARTLLRNDIELSTERRRTFVEMIATESGRLSRIVDDILLASRLDAGGVQVATKSCDAGELTRDVVDTAQIRAPSNVKLRVEAPPELPEIAADPDRLRQVLINILDNAIKYSPDGGEVVVSLGIDDGQVRFHVRDEGLGFPASERERIFERFHRLDPDQTGGVGGTGLGLYICRELVERMDGRIWAESRPGRGSSFFVELPQVDSAAGHLQRGAT
jgi:signal transduction histidine kinase